MSLDTWSTPLDFYEALCQRFGPIDVDVCASWRNFKEWPYISKERNALTTDWKKFAVQHNVWNRYSCTTFYCNPPYTNLMPWIARCNEMCSKYGCHILLLTHDNFSAKWFQHAVATAYEVFLLQPRIQFLPPPGGKASSNSRSSILFRFLKHEPYSSANIRLWQWKNIVPENDSETIIAKLKDCGRGKPLPDRNPWD